jgi:multiple sugar transport system permease protein
MSFQDYKLMALSKPFIGLENYRTAFRDGDFAIALKNTLQYVAMVVPALFVLSLLEALAINLIKRGKALYRAIYFAPVMTGSVAVALVWRYVMHPSYGLANLALRAVGLPPSRWIIGAETAMPSLAMIAIWQSMGYQMILFLAGLQSVPVHLYDAAKIDGAGIWQRFWHITWPLLRPTVTFVLVTSVIGSFQVFDLAYVFGYQGGPQKSLLVLVIYMRDWALELQEVGYASAMAFILFGIIFVFTAIQLRLTRVRWEY